MDFIPSDSRAPRLLVPRLECPYAFLQRPMDFVDKVGTGGGAEGGREGGTAGQPLSTTLDSIVKEHRRYSFSRKRSEQSVRSHCNTQATLPF